MMREYDFASDPNLPRGFDASEEPGAVSGSLGSADPQNVETLLEFDRIREMLAGYSRFSLSRELAEKLHPSWDGETVDRLQAETVEGRHLLDTTGDIGLGGMLDPTSLLQRTALGGALNGKELLAVAGSLSSLQSAVSVVRSASKDVPLLLDIAYMVGDFRHLAERISGSLTETGAVHDSAAPGLARLRHRVGRDYNSIVQELEKMIAGMEVRLGLQSDAISVRGDRLVLEVLSDQRRRVPGIVHDVSNTGSTLFVEPLGVVDLGNTWRETAAEVAREEERVLRELSGLLADRADEAIVSFSAIAEIDFIVARARLATHMHAARVERVGQDSPVSVDLIDARHPLLGDDAVPATMRIGPDYSVLVITGPNAGGKTVALKTVGLLALMHQAGMQVPAGRDSRLAVFSGVYADIGDAQSIERSVSTFSSHIGAVSRILEVSDPGSLVLLDELGTGTDPEEGAALARAIVEDFSERRIPCVITTHHRGVAEFASDADGIENASMELSPTSMLPTYHLVMGLPGRSYAVSVAEHLGLSSSVLDRARELLGDDHEETENLLTSLQSDREELSRVAHTAEEERALAEKLRRKIEVELAELRHQQDDLLEETRVELRVEADELRHTLRRIERDARHSGHFDAARQAANEARRAVRDPNWARDQLTRPPGSEIVSTREDQLEQENDEALSTRASSEAEIESLEPGDVVQLRGLGTQAEVISVEHGQVELLIGGTTARIGLGEVRRLEGVKIARPDKPNIELWRTSKQAEAPHSGGPGGELDLRGRRAYEVHEEVTRFLDQIALEGTLLARIIHGKGTGAVRDAVRQTLARHGSVSAFRYAAPHDGGDGATEVELK